MDTSKEEIVNLRKQINRLKISLMFTQVLMIALLLILGYQCLWSIWNYHWKRCVLFRCNAKDGSKSYSSILWRLFRISGKSGRGRKYRSTEREICNAACSRRSCMDGN